VIVKFPIYTVILLVIKSFAGVLGIRITDAGESPIIEIVSAVIAIGPVLLSSIYVPALIKIVTGLEDVAILLAVSTAFLRLAYGASKDPSPVVSLPY
jgi:hypothetical protein